MSSIQLITGITFYILCLVLSVLLGILSRKISPPFVKQLVVIHFILIIILALLIISTIFSVAMKSKLNSFLPYYSIATFCSGLAISGVAIRQKISPLLKGYFIIFLLSIIAFVISPSKLFSFMATGSLYSNEANTFKLVNNYFMESQQSMIQQSSNQQGSTGYKIYRKFGFFNRTISRDINFGHRIDSVKVLFFEPEKSMILRGYFKSLVSADSAQIVVDLTKPLKKNTITKGK